MNQVTLTLPLDNADALLRGSDLLAGLAKDARAKEPLPQGLELTEAPLPPMPTAPKSEPEAPEFDADGLPWDERIHASTKTTTQDGRWKKKRGVDVELIEVVEAELRGAEVTDPIDGETFTPVTSGDVPPPPPPPAPSMTFTELIKEITENQINPDTVLKAVQSVGLANVGELFNRPDLIPQVARELGIES